jgi:hypothetical protein
VSLVEQTTGFLYKSSISEEITQGLESSGDLFTEGVVSKFIFLENITLYSQYYKANLFKNQHERKFPDCHLYRLASLSNIKPATANVQCNSVI